jgi:sporulation protein YlmC with PRC-barrel domain
MIDQASVPSLMGSTVRDSAGEKIGKVGQVYLDDTTGQPEWVTVRTGLFGTKESFVPLAAARVEGDELIVDIPKGRVHEAPKLDEDGHLSEEQENELYAYYGVSQGPFGRQGAPDAEDYLQTDRQTGVAPTGVPTDYDTTDRRTGMADGDVDYDATDRRTGVAGLEDDPTGTPVGDTDVAQAMSGPGYGEDAGPDRVDEPGPDFARGTDGSVTGEPVAGSPDFARGTDAETAAPGSDEPSPSGPDYARGTDAETGLAGGAGTGLPGGAGTGPAGEETGRRRLRRWQVTDEVAEGDLVDDSGEVVGEIRAERVEITPDDEVPPAR